MNTDGDRDGVPNQVEEAEERLRRAEAHYRRLVETLPVGIFAVDGEGRITEANEVLGRIFGRLASDLLGRRFTEGMAPEEAERADACFHSRVGDGDHPSGHAFRVALPTGEERIIRVVASPIVEEGRVVGCHGVVSDVTEERRREAVLRRLGAVLTASWHEVYIHDARTLRFVQASRGALENLGYSMEELGELTPLDVKRGMPRARYLEILRTLESGEERKVVFETDHHRRDGSTYPVEVRLQLSREDDGGVFVAVVLDLTERKRAEEALLACERYYRSLIENSTDAIIVVDADGMISFATAAVEPVFGWPPSEIVGAHALSWVHPEDMARAREAFEHVRADPTQQPRVVYRMRQPDGSWRMVEAIRTNLLADPAVGGVVINTRDITEWLAAEEQIRFQAGLLDAVDQAVLATDVLGGILYWNPFSETLYGWSKEEVVGRSLHEVVPALAGSEEGGELFARLEAGRSWSGDLLLERRGGSSFPAKVTISPIRAADGEARGFVVLSSDLTERRELEEQLRTSQKLEAVGRLAGGVAHDFNNLLTVIKGHTHVLLEESPAGCPARGDLRAVMETVDRASSLTRQLLAFSRKQVLQRQVLDANQVLSGMADMLRRMIGEDVELRLDLGSGPHHILADRGQIEQVVMNLAVNARDAMPRGGRLELRTRRTPLPARLGGPRDGAAPSDHVCVEVTDTGHGIDPETLRKIFEPFFTTKEAGHGTGLGLSTVYGIVQQSGGAITAESEPGRGAAFRVYLPCREGAAPAATTPQPAGAPGGSETILVVEDDEPIRSLIQSILQRKGYSVLEANNGKAALLLSEMYRGPIHLLLTDVVMPRMSGRELAERLTAVRAGTRILYMSGYTDDAVLRHGIEEGQPFLPKPFAPDQLLRGVREVLDAAPAR